SGEGACRAARLTTIKAGRRARGKTWATRRQRARGAAMIRNPLAHALAAALYVAAPAALAADGHLHLETAPTDLDGVVVLGVAPVAAATFTPGPKLPRQPVPASDGADYLRTIPGFSTLRSGGTNGDPVLRGMFGSRIALLTNDGVLSGACPSRMDNAMSYIAPETYDRLTVVKGPQTVLWGGGASAGTVRFEREIPYFDRPGVRAQGSLLAGSNGRNDQVLDASAGTPSGWTPDADTVLELSAGAGDAEARYAGRGMDGSRFRRDNLGLRFEKKHMGGVLDAVVASLYHNEVDHVMDNYTLRDPDPSSSMPMPMASNVGDTSQGGRVALTFQHDSWELTAGVDGRQGEHRRRSAMGRDAWRQQPWTHDADTGTLGVFAESHWHIDEVHHLMSGLRVDRARAEDRRATVGSGMNAMPNPTAGQRREE